MTFLPESFEDTLSFAESLGWIEPEVDVWDHNSCDELEYQALEFIESRGHKVAWDGEIETVM